jgi:chemotaxis methyl-accepting protein methylase
VIGNFYNSLQNGGYLFVGYSETLQQIASKFIPLEIKGSFVYLKKA